MSGRRGGPVVAPSGAAVAAAAAVVAAAMAISACSSSGHAATGSTGPSRTDGAPTTMAVSTIPTSGPAVTPTVFDCGGGAYKPSTLLIVCGVGSSMATGVTWSAWSSSGATGHGNVALTGHAAQPADLSLGTVVETSSGPEYSSLTITWTGSSPDGHDTDTVRLDTAPGSS